ncbi:MAG: 4-(cytidine 5'-diphospho)-2-C-methyl-D-erythritol kinase [Planctomycetes bacterium]|nr:4-(cytidine 5'-diphospho)-2-C-methyl-D-erythritol kinase [Planctomycetota bacterium]
MVRTLTTLAPAKLNLALSVGPPNSDGMHPICSWMVSVGLCDELTVTMLQPDRLSRYAILWHEEAKSTSDIDWSITKDLAVRAHLALQEHTKRQLPVQLKLEKRIPVGGGLGGGSSNAAAMLNAVNQLFELDLSKDELIKIAANLGSDVPFFVSGGSAVVTGLGDQIDLHDQMPIINAVIVFPQIKCPTSSVYRAFDELSPSSLNSEAVSLAAKNNNSSIQPDAIFNDLTQAAIDTAPQLKEHMQQLSDLAQRKVHIAGSGSSLFILCDDELHSQHLCDAIETKLDLPAVAVQSCEMQNAN